MNIKKSLPYLLESLKSENKMERITASIVIQLLGTREAIPSLIKNINSSDSSLVIPSIIALKNLDAKIAIPSLIKLINEENRISFESLLALVSLGSKEKIPELLRLLESFDPKIRLFALTSLKYLKAEEITPNLLLSFAFKDPDESIRMSALILACLEKNKYSKFNDFHEIIEMETLIVKNTNGIIISRLCENFGIMINENNFSEKILSALKSNNINTRRMAILMVGLTKKTDWLSILTELTKDSNQSIRFQAIRAIGNFRNEESYLILEKIFQDNENNEHVRVFALEALVSMKNKKVIDTLVNLINDENMEIRTKAIAALAHIDHRLVAAHLLENIKKVDFKINHSDLFGRTHLSIDYYSETIATLGNEINFDLIEMIKTHNIESKNIAARTLGILKERKVIPLIFKTDNLSRKNHILAELGAKEIIPIIIKDLYLKKDRASLDKLIHIDARETNSLFMDTLYQGYNDKSINQFIDSKKRHLIPNILSALSDRSETDYLLNLELFGDFISGEHIEFLLLYLDTKHITLKVISTSIFLHMLRKNNINQTQKRLIHKALTRIDDSIIKAAKERLLDQDRQKTEEKAKILNLPINQPGLEENPLPLSELKQKLNQQNQAYANWRKRRDTETDPTTEQTNNLEDPAPFIYEYAYAIAHESEKDGIELLGHNLYKVREAAARGLANGDALSVDLLKKLEKKWLETNDPIERQGVYHAIDIALLAIEGVGYEKELADLKTYEKELLDKNNDRSIASIHPRVEWTKIQLQWRVDANKELEELAARQLPKLLKEYCLNEDGTDMKPEECTMEQ